MGFDPFFFSLLGWSVLSIFLGTGYGNLLQFQKFKSLCGNAIYIVSLSKICLWVEVFLKIASVKFVVERVRPQFMFCVIVVLPKIFGHTRVTLVVIVCFLILISAAGWRKTCVQNRVLVKCVCHGTSSLHLEFWVYGFTAIREFSNRRNQITG